MKSKLRKMRAVFVGLQVNHSEEKLEDALGLSKEAQGRTIRTISGGYLGRRRLSEVLRELWKQGESVEEALYGALQLGVIYSALRGMVEKNPFEEEVE